MPPKLLKRKWLYAQLEEKFTPAIKKSCIDPFLYHRIVISVPLYVKLLEELRFFFGFRWEPFQRKDSKINQLQIIKDKKNYYPLLWAHDIFNCSVLSDHQVRYHWLRYFINMSSSRSKKIAALLEKSGYNKPVGKGFLVIVSKEVLGPEKYTEFILTENKTLLNWTDTDVDSDEKGMFNTDEFKDALKDVSEFVGKLIKLANGTDLCLTFQTPVDHNRNQDHFHTGLFIRCLAISFDKQKVSVKYNRLELKVEPEVEEAKESVMKD